MRLIGSSHLRFSRERFGMELVDVQEVAIHGGSILVTAQI
jgi:C-methyltransferase-like protein